jgi:hypothetical protein
LINLVKDDYNNYKKGSKLGYPVIQRDSNPDLDIQVIDKQKIEEKNINFNTPLRAIKQQKSEGEDSLKKSIG